MKEVTAYESITGQLFKTEDACIDYEKTLDFSKRMAYRQLTEKEGKGEYDVWINSKLKGKKVNDKLAWQLIGEGSIGSLYTVYYTGTTEYAPEFVPF